MTPSSIDPKERILQAAVRLLQEEGGEVSVRRIAAQAGVGVGLVNYHFGSKENLLNQAFLRILAERAAAWLDPSGYAARTAGLPLARLKMLARQAGETACAYPSLARIGIEHALLRGGFEPARRILPLLRQHYGPHKTEPELRALALALTTALGAAFLRLDETAAFVGLDSHDPSGPAALAALVDLLIDQVLGEEARRVGWKS
jgi:AcrR family transcriptional regulator